MKRVLLACLGAFCLLTASAFADEGIPSTSVLNDMGLSGMQVLTDSDALAVRGKGWITDIPLLQRDGGKKPWVAAGGISIAYLDHKDGKAGSGNFYLADAKHKAGGLNGSYATKTTTEVNKTVVDGWVKIKRHTMTKTIEAGGYSSGHAF